MVKSSNRQSATKGTDVHKASPSPAKKNVRMKVEHPVTDDIHQRDAPESIVTPSGRRAVVRAVEKDFKPDVQKALFRDGTSQQQPHAVTPARSAIRYQKVESPAKRKLIFGRLVNEVSVQNNVRQVYSLVRKLTGSIGGNGSSGPIYGELTMGSMQKVVNAMVEHTGFDSASRFIDVGSGIGKPNLHVAQDPGVEFSYGIEVEHDRWLLGMTCLNGVLEAASKQTAESHADECIHHQCMFECGDIRAAQMFDPFTHVYMFSCGFPPALWTHLSEMWNRSTSPYMICYSAPRHMIDDYEFDLELVTQLPTSMHGSKEGHMAYIYRRTLTTKLPSDIVVACDPVFQPAWDLVKADDLELLRSVVQDKLAETMHSNVGPATRSSRRKATP